MENKVFLITGSTSGIGKSISLSLAKKNAKLFLIVRSIKKFNEIYSKYRNCKPIFNNP